uniref:Uncharacterized protein n=1 Tax=Oryza rufipogon TaxID=4529 RepID=A0A0E0NAB9_ORYRU
MMSGRSLVQQNMDPQLQMGLMLQYDSVHGGAGKPGGGDAGDLDHGDYLAPLLETGIVQIKSRECKKMQHMGQIYFGGGGGSSLYC